MNLQLQRYYGVVVVEPFVSYSRCRYVFHHSLACFKKPCAQATTAPSESIKKTAPRPVQSSNTHACSDSSALSPNPLHHLLLHIARSTHHQLLSSCSSYSFPCSFAKNDCDLMSPFSYHTPSQPSHPCKSVLAWPKSPCAIYS